VEAKTGKTNINNNIVFNVEGQGLILLFSPEIASFIAKYAVCLPMKTEFVEKLQGFFPFKVSRSKAL
jgi:hypothetical protein